jgi:superfamily I DNA and/or RNA helicase
VENKKTVQNKVVLPELLEEFRLSLEEEINAVKKQSTSSAVPLNNGRKLSISTGQYQYQFKIDNLINSPDGSLANLVVEGRQPLEASIIAIDDNCIIISISEDLGDFIPYARLESDLSLLIQKLINRIEKKAQDKNDAGERMLGKKKYSGSPTEPKYIIDDSKISPSQKKAICSAIGRNTTYIWGPPGTGKTTTIAKIMEELFRSNRTVLLVSHTNTAVDQALINFSKSLKSEELDSCSILRFGIPKNDELVNNYPQVLLETHIERLSKELIDELKNNKIIKKEKENDIIILERKITDYILCIDFKNHKEKLIEKIKEFNYKQTEYSKSLNDIEVLSTKKELFDEKINECKEYVEIKKIIFSIENEIVELKNELINLSEETIDITNRVQDLNFKIDNHNLYNDLNEKLGKQISTTSQKQFLDRLLIEINELKSNISNKKNELLEYKSKLSISENSNAISRIFKALQTPEKIQISITNLNDNISLLNKTLNDKVSLYNSKVNIFNSCIKMKKELQGLIVESSIEELLKYKNSENRRISHINDKIFQVSKKLEVNEKLKMEKEELLILKRDQFNYNPEEILEIYNKLLEQIRNEKKYANVVLKELKNIKDKVEELLKNHIQVKENINFNEILKMLDDKYSNMIIDFEYFNINEETKQLEVFKNMISDIDKKIDELNIKLSEIEKQIIAQSKVVCTTLTKAYLSDDLQIRKFDTVILDEASMAPVPALWVTAYMAEKNIIVVGDFRQLPPIVISKDKNALNWLGKDIFEISKIKEMYENKIEPENFVKLVEQYRMEKEIADIANIYYGGILKSPQSERRREEKKQFINWYNGNFDSSIILLNTQNFNAWVTSVVRGGSTSRVNILSANLCVNLAEELTKKYRINLTEKTETKVLIISPYRPHTKFVELLIKDGKTPENIIRAGTVHSFQGSEADIVIFDLVVDDPHWRVNLFMNTKEINEQMRRLFNVAITRAKFKLFIVGDFDYCLKKGKNSELYKLLDYLIENKKCKVYDAKEIFPNIVPKLTEAIVGGNLEAYHKRLGLTGENYFKFLFLDIKNAINRIIIYSPFISRDRLSVLMPQLQLAINNNVKIFVVTKAKSDRSNSEISNYIEVENALEKLGVKIIHKKNMHEKLVFIDDDIIWNGSLNTLSYSLKNPTEEFMERRKSKEVYDDYIKLLKVNELLDVATSVRESICPICSGEMIVAEGSKNEPFYWRCINDNCFTRGINQKYPYNGEMTCGECDGELEFSFVKEPRWKCKLNGRHYQRLFKSHLKLPKMLSKIPKKEMLKLNKYLEEKEHINLRDNQITLFDVVK